MTHSSLNCAQSSVEPQEEVRATIFFFYFVPAGILWKEGKKEVYSSGLSSVEIPDPNISCWQLQRVAYSFLYLRSVNYFLLSSTSLSPWIRRSNVV